ncbi:MAG TPA: tetratricopeptide repeat protein, partial [Gemmataceae bacterium]|nr:tetratricopeptide repeat protein [Gemmataceae bacterium]
MTAMLTRMADAGAEALGRQGWDCFRRGRLGEAEACLRRALALRPDDARACNNFGVVLAEQGRH